MNEINYDGLKKRGFLRSKEEELFTLRTRMASGNYDQEHLKKLSEIAEKYGRGLTHLTVRQGIEIPFIKFEDIDAVEKAVKGAGIETGTSGPRLRATTTCPGNNWCKSGLINTFRLFDRIEELGISCGMDLPHKFKIAISGCPNTCTRPQTTEIGIHGAVDLSPENKGKIGYAIYIGGCGGKTPHIGRKLDKIFSEDEVLLIIEKVIKFFKQNAKSRQRLALLIEELGWDNFLKAIGKTA